MAIEDDFAAHLAATSGLTAIVAQRIFAVKAPQNTVLPALVYKRAAAPGQHEHDMRGLAGHCSARFEVWCCAASYDGARRLAAAVRDTLDPRNGSATPATWTDSQVANVLIEDEYDDFQSLQDGSDQGFFYRSLVFTFYFE